MILPLIAIEPSLVADIEESAPRNSPTGVREIPTIQTSNKIKKSRQHLYQCFDSNFIATLEKIVKDN